MSLGHVHHAGMTRAHARAGAAGQLPYRAQTKTRVFAGDGVPDGDMGTRLDRGAKLAGWW
jgi:hypothetical protein